QKGEVTFVQPAQKILRLAELGNLLWVGYLVQRFSELKRLAAHLRPILDGGTHIAQDALETVDQFRTGLIAYPINLDRYP
ncbi:hypothetical protein SB780_39990, partial [Burkholderia sp. SIMBA_057]